MKRLLMVGERTVLQLFRSSLKERRVWLRGN